MLKQAEIDGNTVETQKYSMLRTFFKKTYENKNKFKYDYCNFEAKSPKGLKTHEG